MKTFGFEEVQDDLNKIGKSIPNVTEKFLKKQAQYLVGAVKKLTPKDTGTLRATWQVSRIKGSMKGLSIKVYNNTSYASAVNDGHRIKKGGRTVGFVTGQFFLERALRGMKDKQKELAKEILDSITKRMR
ncbi:MAG: HK97 gp10 family phage protein [Cetobacterium sp.]